MDNNDIKAPLDADAESLEYLFLRAFMVVMLLMGMFYVYFSLLTNEQKKEKYVEDDMLSKDNPTLPHAYSEGPEDRVKVKIACSHFDCPDPTIGCSVAVENEAGYVVVTGGMSSTDDISTDVHVYSSSERRWDAFATSGHNHGRVYANMFFLQFKMLLFGGLDSEHTARSDAMYFDFESEEWKCIALTGSETRKTDVFSSSDESPQVKVKARRKPAGRFNATSCMLNESTMVVFGGRGDGSTEEPAENNGLFNDVWYLNLSVSEQQQVKGVTIPPLISMSWEPLVCVQDDENTSITYAHAASSSESILMEGKLNPALYRGPVSREAHCAAIIDDNMYIFGGDHGALTGVDVHHDINNITLQGYVEVLNLTTRKWSLQPTTGPHMGSPVIGGAAHALGDSGKILVISSESSGLFNTLYILDTRAVMPATASGPAKTVLQWSVLAFEWKGDWSLVPGLRLFTGSSLDAGEGILYVCGGHSLVDDSLSPADSSGETPAAEEAAKLAPLQGVVMIDVGDIMNIVEEDVDEDLLRQMEADAELEEEDEDDEGTNAPPPLVHRGVQRSVAPLPKMKTRQDIIFEKHGLSLTKNKDT